MKIGELARVTGTPVETIRYYEREGLLAAPARTDGNFRIYEDTHAERLSFIRHCRSLDMSLDEIRILLRFKDAPGANCGDVNTLLDAHIVHVAARIRELRVLERQLKSLRAVLGDILELAEELQKGTIERVLANNGIEHDLLVVALKHASVG